MNFVGAVFQLPLSGSLYLLYRLWRFYETHFQLPLSGSRDVRGGYTDPRFFKPFNSLSRDHYAIEVIAVRDADISLSTPSLGITKLLRGIFRESPSDLTPFNSLSRDHLPNTGVLGSTNTRMIFQLPLSGSPSPIPGFSGSPRLSAAAPLRTSVFSGHYLKI